MNQWEESKIAAMNDDELIKQFKAILEPGRCENQDMVKKTNPIFLLLCKHLNERNYYIEEFPLLFTTTKSDLYNFGYKEIRKYIKDKNNNPDGDVTWKSRRELIHTLQFKSKNTIGLSKNSLTNFEEIKLNSNKYTSYSPKDKLVTIASLLEKYLKDGGKFKDVNVNANGFIILENEKVKNYRKLLHVFRHADNDAIEERKNYTENDLELLILTGEWMLNTITLFYQEDKNH